MKSASIPSLLLCAASSCHALLSSRRSSSRSLSMSLSTALVNHTNTAMPSITARHSTGTKQEMMTHSLLSREEELALGKQVVAARKLRENMERLWEDRRIHRQRDTGQSEEEEFLDWDFLSYQLEYLAIYGFRPRHDDSLLEDERFNDHARHRSHYLSQWKNSQTLPLVDGKDVGVSQYYSMESKSKGRHDAAGTMNFSTRNSYTSLLHIPIHLLSEQEAVSILNLSGGKQEAIQILIDGAHAREELMRKNLKLVISISKSWMRNSFSTKNSNLGGSTGNRFSTQMYQGSWDRPSLDEAVQEGMLGLARAVDKYDPDRGLRFSTYATHWVTSYIRVCFQRAITGCLKVPSQLHDIKSAYKQILKDHIHIGEIPPSTEVIAKELGISEQRLTSAIRSTESLISVDAPVISPGSGNYKGSAAGGDNRNSQELLILDTLRCAEPKPEDQVEISFLRQCLENAMATELTPYERDILRLRLGLDNGEGKTVREIVAITGGTVSVSNVRATEKRAFKKLRSPTSVHTHNLLSYLDFAGADVFLRR